MATAAAKGLSGVKKSASRRVRSTVRRVGRSPGDDLGLIGRLGLAGRTGFYAILSGLVVRIALLQEPPRHQADANGALSLVSHAALGKVAIGLVALGFVLFGAGRLTGAIRDSTAPPVRRWMTAAQGIFYVALAYVPASFLAGDQRTGSQQQQERTSAEILHLPGGRMILGALGLVVVGVCGFQIRQAIEGDFRDGLDLRRAPRLVKRLSDTAGLIGITARALVFLPIGVFLIVSAVESDPRRAHGLDAELLDLDRHSWGLAVLSLVAVGLAVFVVYSAIETRYRKVVCAR